MAGEEEGTGGTTLVSQETIGSEIQGGEILQLAIYLLLAIVFVAATIVAAALLQPINAQQPQAKWFVVAILALGALFFAYRTARYEHEIYLETYYKKGKRPR